MIHKPVLLKEVIENLNLKPGMTVVDGTLGAGGHSEAILERILPGGRLISIDWDKTAAENFEKRLREGISIAKKELIKVYSASVNNNKKNDDRAYSHFEKLGNRKGEIVGYWRGVTDNYRNIKEIIRGLGIDSVGVIFVDLGFSSDQIENPERGFSFLRNGPLDMRYSSEIETKTAADIVNNYTEEELYVIFRDLGEEKFAKRIAREIAKSRKIKKIETTGELVEIISKAIPEKHKRGKIHPVKSRKVGLAMPTFNRVNFATKVFQALRIETNQEFDNLKHFLGQAAEVLASEGILAIISFHSLEDRIVKQYFRDESRDCICPPTFPKCVCGHRARLKIITRKPIAASVEEIRENPRSRSAKLRIAMRI